MREVLVNMQAAPFEEDWHDYLEKEIIGHDGVGIVTQVGPGVMDLKEGD